MEGEATMENNAGMEGGKKHKDRVAALHPALQNDDLLVSILRIVSQSTGSYTHALVCRKWTELSAQAQATFQPRSTVDPDTRPLSEEDLLSQVSQFSNLTRIDLEEGSVEKITDFFCTGVNKLSSSSSSSGTSVPSWGLSHLTDLRIQATCDCVSEVGWGSFFQSTPRIRNLDIGCTSTMAAVLPALSGLRRLHLKKVPEHVVSTSSGSAVFSSVLAKGVGTLSQLRELYLKLFDGQSVLSVLSTLHSLRKLHIAHCDLVEFPPNFCLSSKLQEFHLESFYFLSSLPDMSSFPDLRSFGLAGCYCIKSIPASLLSLSRLTALTTKECYNLESLPEGNWGGLTNLKILHLFCLPKLQQLPSGVCSLRALEVLRVRDCPRLQDFPAGYWDRMENLRIVDLEKMEVHGQSVCRIN